MPDRPPPWTLAPEQATLVAFLEYLRASVVAKLEGLDDGEATRPMVTSGTSLLGLAKHLILVETAWFQLGVAGSDSPLPSGELCSDDTIDSVIAAYRRAVVQSNAIVEGVEDLDQRCARTVTAPEPMSVRWVLVHMIEETARHAGHMDILREQIDGTVGR